MAYVRQKELPASEPVTLTEVKQRLRIDSGFTADDNSLTGLIKAAREIAETYTGRSLAKRAWTETLDSFPYYTDTIQNQQAFPPSYYSLPRYATTLWNYSQMIKLSKSPVISVTELRYIDASGNPQTLAQDTDFILDRISEPARLFPMPGSYWPPTLYTPNAVQIDYETGYDQNPTATDEHTISANPPNQQPDSTLVTGIPESIRDAIIAVVMSRYNDPLTPIPHETLLGLFGTNTAIDFAPTRG